MEFDLDAVRAARAETRTEPRTLRYRGREWALAEEIRYDFLQLSDDEALDELLGSEQAIEFRALRPRPSTEDMQALVMGILPFYGFKGLGESAASNGSSRNGSRPSKRISRTSTQR